MEGAAAVRMILTVTGNPENPRTENTNSCCGKNSRAGIRQNKEVNTLLNLNNKKTRKMLSTVVIVIVVLAMVLPMVLGSLLSII
jgi:hypothetical protein